MGRIIDRIVFTSVAAFGLFALFMDSFGSIPVSFAMTFISMACLKKLSGLLPGNPFGKMRRRCAAARKKLSFISMMTASDARHELETLINAAYPGALENSPLSVVLRHPSGAPLSPDDILRLWKIHRAKDRLIIATPAKASKEALSLGSSLKSPVLRILDGDALTDLIYRTSPAPEPAPPPEKRPLRSRLRSLKASAARARPAKCLASGAFMLLMFFVTGYAVYLASAVILLAISAISLRLRSAPASLFSE